jgi:hypothetical protein
MLPRLIVIKDKYHADEESLLLQGFHTPDVDAPFFARLKDNRVFGSVISCKGQPGDHERGYDEQIKEYYDSFFAENNIELKKFTEIYLSFDTFNPLGAYLDLRGITHNVIIATCQNWVYDISHTLGKLPQKYVDWMRSRHALLGEGEYTKIRYMHSNIEKIEVPLEKDVLLDFDEMFLSCGNETKGKLVSCLDLPVNVNTKTDSYLVLPNSTGYMSPRTRLPVNRRCYVYQLILDFYCNAPQNANIFYKEHPQVNLNDGNKYFYNCTVLDCVIPFELFALKENLRFTNLVCVNSTSSIAAKNMCDKIFSAHVDIFYEFRLMFLYYAVFKIDDIVSDRSTAHHHCSVNLSFLSDFAAQVFAKHYEWKGINQTILSGNIFAVLGKNIAPNCIYIALKNATSNVKAIIMYTEMFEIERFKIFTDYLVKIKIKKCVTSSSCIADTDDEQFFFFCKDKAIRDKVSNMNEIKNCYNSNLVLNIIAS